MGKQAWRLGILLVVGLLVLVGCSKPQTGKTLVIGAAASLNEAFTEIGQLFEADNPGWKVEFSFASSGNLKTSIEKGAPIDVFASAAEKQMLALKDSGHIAGDTIKPLVKNELVLIVPRKSTVNHLEEIVNLRRIALGEPESVPAGQYAQESLMNLGYWGRIKERLVFTKDVRQALFYVEQDEVDAGFVYATDAAKSDSVRIITALPEESYEAPSYPIGILSNTANREGAEKWVELVTSDKGQKVLSKYGFKKP